MATFPSSLRTQSQAREKNDRQPPAAANITLTGQDARAATSRPAAVQKPSARVTAAPLKGRPLSGTRWLNWSGHPHLPHPVRVCQVHLELGVPQWIAGPVSAVGRFDRDRRTPASRTDLPHQNLRVIVDPHPLKLVASIVIVVSNPSILSRTHGSGGPAPLWHHVSAPRS
jgi:hypothetical protein